MDSTKLLENLAELQRLRRCQAHLTPDQKSTVMRIRKETPVQVLAHFDDMVKRDHKAVAEVHNGVCTGCYLKLPTALAADDTDELPVCETCGAYLLFERAESAHGLSLASG